MIVASLLLNLAAGPSFNCARAETTVEQTVCDDPNLARRDRAVALLYREPRDLFDGRIREQQRRWLRKRDQCRSPSCIREAYDKRIAQLAPISNFSQYLIHERYVNNLMIASIGEGWFVFSLFMAGTSKTSGQLVTGEAAGLVRVDGGAGFWRSAAGCTLQFQQGPQDHWRLTQSAECGHAFGGLSSNGSYMPEAEWWTSGYDAEVEEVE